MKTEKSSHAHTPSLNSPTRKQKPLHPAELAGKSRCEYFQTDLWVIDGKQIKVPANTLPKELKASLKSYPQEPSAKSSYHFDESKFAIDRVYGGPQGHGVYAWVHSYQLGNGVVEVSLRDDSFVFTLFAGAHGKKFPFTEHEFLKAVYAAKTDVELDTVPESDSELGFFDKEKEATR